MKKINDYEKEFRENIGNPVVLAEISDQMAIDYSYYLGLLEPIKIQKPNDLIKIKTMHEDGKLREKYLSDALTENIWKTKEAGQKEIALKTKLKSLEKMQSAIKSHLITLNNSNY